jgi:branched-chain amino acid transport system substrate-binding protein
MPSRSLRACCLVLLLLASVPSPAGAQEPVKIGFMAPLTGIFAPAGKDMAEGLRMAFEQAGYQAAGKKLELIEEDNEGNPATAQTKYRKLVTQDRIHAFTGVLLSNIGYALIAPIERDRLPSLFLTTPDDLTKRRPSKWVLRSNFAASQPMQALGDYASKTLKYRRVFAIAMDNPFGHEGIGGFQKVFEDAGGRITQKVWVPLNTMDFAPFLSQVPRDVDAVVQVFVAGQAVRFAKQWGESPLHGKVPLIGTGVFSDQSSLVGMGDEVIGYVGAAIWAPTLDNPANRTFMQMAQEKLKRTPSYFHAVMYSAGRWIIEAVKSVGGQMEDREKLLAAIRKASETTPDPRGPIKLDEYGNPTENVYIVKVEKVGGRLQNTVVHTYPMVSQFWTYRPEEYLKMPAYDRNHPPVKP